MSNSSDFHPALPTLLHGPLSLVAAGQQHAVPERGHVGRSAAGLHQAGGAEGGSAVRDWQPPLPHHQPGTDPHPTPTPRVVSES